MQAQDNALIGAAGEHFILYQLLSRNLIAALSPRNTHAADIVVFGPSMSVGSMVQVKTRTARQGKGWIMGAKNEDLDHPRLFYALLDVEPEVPEVFAALVEANTIEVALAHRRSRTRAGNRLRRNRTYALSGGGPAFCDACGDPLKGDTRSRRNGTKVSVYRHRDGAACPGWPVREVPTEVLDEQVARLLDGAAPNRESAARIRAALARPVVGPDRLAIARLDARLKALGTEIAAPAPERGMAEILSEIEATRRERERLAAEPKQDDAVDPEDALTWLASLGALWRETSDEGRRRLALATFERINVVSSPTRASHRIVSVEATEEAERRGLILALPASLEVTMVGDTGFEPVTSRM